MKKYLIILILFFVANGAFAADFLVTSLQKSDGLSSNNVTCVCLDARGRVFVGTAGGLNIYDGASLRTVGASDFSISALYCDGAKVYVGAENGLYQYNSATDALERITLGTQWGVEIYCQVTGICKCGPSLVISTMGQGLFVMDMMHNSLRQHSVNMSFVTSLSCINDNTVVFATTDSGVYSANLSSGEFAKICESRQICQISFNAGKLWCVKSAVGGG